MATYYLSHAGIKGMKWGVRRFQNKDGSLTPEGKARYGVDDQSGSHEDYKKARSTSVRNMSDAELKKALERVRMEEDYKRLTAVQKSEGRKWVESVLQESGKEIAKHFIVKYGKAGIQKGIEAGGDVYKTGERRKHILEVVRNRKKK